MRVPIPELGQYGILKDAIPEAIAQNGFSDGNNVRFRNGYVEKMEGHAQVFSTPSAKPNWIQSLSTVSKRFWAYVTQTKAWVTDGTTETEITRAAGVYTGAVTDKVVGGVLSGNLVWTNNVDAPQYWNGNTATDCDILTDWTSTWRCKSLRPWKNRLVAMGINKNGTLYPHMIKISVSADPGAIPLTWIPAATNDAEERDLAETQDVCIDSGSLGDIQICYKRDSYYGLQEIGGQEAFRTWLISDKMGMLAPNCWAAFPGGHVVLAPGNLFTHGGGAPTPILEGRNRDALFNDMDSTYRDQCFLVSNPRRSEVWICYPQVGYSYCTKALIWNYDANTFGYRELPNIYHACTGLVDASSISTWDGDSAAWSADTFGWDFDPYNQNEQRLILASDDTKLYIADSGASFNGTDPTSYIERTGLDLGDSSAYKTVTALVPHIEAPTGTAFAIRLAGQADVSGGVTWSAPITYTIGTNYKADGFSSGRYVGYRITCTASVAWRMRKIEIEAVGGGAY